MVKIKITAFGCMVMLVFAGAVFGLSSFNTDAGGVAIHGYDSVAYFTMEMPVEGSRNLEYSWQGATWRFSSEEHRNLFIKNPDRYAPRYGGYCAYGVAVNALFDIEPEAWSIVDGKLYLNKNLDVRETWKQDIRGNIRKAEMNWPALRSTN